LDNLVQVTTIRRGLLYITAGTILQGNLFGEIVYLGSLTSTCYEQREK
jgi:hypothetical protein